MDERTANPLAIEADPDPITVDEWSYVLPDDQLEQEWEYHEGVDFVYVSLHWVLEQLQDEGLNFDPNRPDGYPAWLLAQAYLFTIFSVWHQIPARFVIEQAARIGVSDSALRQARSKLRVFSTKRAGVRHGGWWWRAPANLQRTSDLLDFDPRWGLWHEYR